MGYTLPGWLDEILDFIGINFPNVDEDDYREMADAMRDFAEKFEGHGGDAHKAVTRILSSSEGWAVDAMEKHWSHVKASHLEKVPELARLFADACDVVADIIFGMKRKAEVELAVMAGSVGLSIGLAAFTGGLSAVIGAAEIAAMRQLVKRIVDEAADRIVEELLARVTEPVNAKLQAMIEDVVLDLAEGAFSLPPEAGGDSGKGSGHGGMQLASASGADGGAGEAKVTRIDHVEFEDGAGKVSGHGGELHLASSASLSRAKGAFGRTRGKDPFTQAFDGVLHAAVEGSEKALKKVTKHVAETIPDRVKATSRTHKGNDIDIGDRARRIKTGQGGDGPDARMYILNSDGSVNRLLPSGRIDPNGLTADDHRSLQSIIQPDGTVWRPQTKKDMRKWRTGKGHQGVVQSTKIDPSTSDLAQATQLARKARDDYGGGNYASGRYVDPQSNVESILIGYSDDRFHSERNIGHPLLGAGAKSGLQEVFTEREPCQLNPRCNKWLDHFWGSDVPVTHVADYDQSDPKHKNDEHNAYIDQLKSAHGKK